MSRYFQEKLPKQGCMILPQTSFIFNTFNRSHTTDDCIYEQSEHGPYLLQKLPFLLHQKFQVDHMKKTEVPFSLLKLSSVRICEDRFRIVRKSVGTEQTSPSPLFPKAERFQHKEKHCF